MPTPAAPARATPLPTNIDQVIDRLTELVEFSILGASRAGYFAALYRRVTITIRDLLGQGYFDDDARMERLDVTFANRYLAAAADYPSGGPRCTAPWVVAFDALERREPIILQHLMAGMNAHIELDLGVACATIAPGPKLAGLRDDFDKINTVLATLSPLVEEEIGDLSPAIRLAEKVGKAVEKPIVDTGMLIARSTAWKVAETLAPLSGSAWDAAIARRAAEVGRWGEEIVDPPLLARAAIGAIQAVESDDARAIVRELNKTEPIDFRGKKYQT